MTYDEVFDVNRLRSSNSMNSVDSYKKHVVQQTLAHKASELALILNCCIPPTVHLAMRIN